MDAAVAAAALLLALALWPSGWGPEGRLTRWQIAVDWIGLARYCVWLAWLVISRVALTAGGACAIYASLGYTPATAPDLHGVLAGVSVYLTNRARERGTF